MLAAVRKWLQYQQCGNIGFMGPFSNGLSSDSDRVTESNDNGYQKMAKLPCPLLVGGVGLGLQISVGVGCSNFTSSNF